MKKLVSKEGKLFGIINVIDLLVLLFIVGAAAVVFLFATGKISVSEKKDDFGGPVTDVDIVYYTEELSDFVAKQIRYGALVYDDACMHTLGKVTDFRLGKSLLYNEKDDGSFAVVEKDGYCSAFITGQANGTRTRLGFTYNKANYGVGHSMVIRAGDAKIYLRIYDIHATQRRLRRPLTATSDEKYQEMCK